ncbi:MAG: Asp-tRNA(Asn)/Glu-tRNA(Gln) amidotransferase subunit GatA [Alphaproteobacteria bacterium]|nr:Asp-tRNA(Asn)/Glu-tRNA(Gln) amidotransferase subunit GatA [Alphaproteobacteria bacterium]MCL2504938.1 Asp-tRNA(Asn)/Glu-tRNA(Gln) amidotransferase subunit GatA [Alphaproteobacteria bacterium]
MTKLTDLTVVQALNGLKNKEFSAVELVHAHIDGMQKAACLNAFITETPELALAQARVSDARRASGHAKALDGIPLAIKDLFCTRGIRTTSASKMLENFVPPYESTITQKLLDAGAVTLGKTNLDEFAMGSTTATSYFKPTINPWTEGDILGAKRKLIPGGSSGGSAAAVAARIALAALGTDTGGSIRQPASLTGTVGIKPTYGRCSRFGIVAFASSLDQAGPMTRNVEDAALMLKLMSGFDEKDSMSVDIPVPDYTQALGKGVKGLKIGIPSEYRIKGMNADVDAVWQKAADMLKAAGAEVMDITLPHTKYALPVYYIIAPAEASSNFAKYDGVRFGLRVNGESLNDMYDMTRSEGFGKEVQRRIMIGTYVLSAGYYDAYYLRAQQVRRLIRQDFINAFKKCDVILTPAAPSPAFAIEEKQKDPLQLYLEDVFTVTLNLAGLPGICLPVGLSSEKLPIGMQLIGKAFDEETLISAARSLEESANFTHKPLFTV